MAHRRTLIASSLLAIGLAMSPAAWSQALQMRISHAAAESDWLHKSMLMFKENIEKALPGQIAVSVHGASSLFRQGTEVPALQRGNLEMSTMTTFEVEQQLPEYGILSSGYLFRDYDHLAKVMRGPIGKDYYDAFDYTPWNNDLIADLARAVITQEQLGEADGSPDLLAIGFSQPDKIGHAYGPDSHEVMDSILRLDRTLAGLFQFLDEKVGLANCNIVLTADHGAAPLPERNPAQGGRVRGADFDQVVYAALDRQFGTLTDNERWAVRDGLGYHLNPAALAQKKISASRLEDAVQAALRSIPAVASAYTRAQLTDPAPLDAMGEALRLSFYPPRSPDVLAVLKPYFIDRAAPGTTHGTPYDYDNHVPLLWYGAGVKSGLHPEQVGVDDLAPTLVRLLGLPPLPQAAGRILF